MLIIIAVIKILLQQACNKHATEVLGPGLTNTSFNITIKRKVMKVLLANNNGWNVLPQRTPEVCSYLLLWATDNDL